MQSTESLPYLIGVVVVALVISGIVFIARETTVEGFELKVSHFTLKARKLTTRTRRKGADTHKME